MNLESIKKGFIPLPKLDNRYTNVISIDNLITDSFSITQINCYQDRAKFDFRIVSDFSSQKAISSEEIKEFITTLEKEFEEGAGEEIIITTNPIYKGINGAICPVERYFTAENTAQVYPDILKLRHAIACASIQSFNSGIDIQELRKNFFDSRTLEQLKGYSRNLLATWLFFRNE